MKAGVTGSRYGWTDAQGAAFENIVKRLNLDEFHHGDCIGVDVLAAETVEKIHGREILHCHPPTSGVYRAHYASGVMYPAEDYMVRNRAIVDAVQVLFVIPRTSVETIRSGTWATFRMMRDTGKATLIIHPNGKTNWGSDHE